MTFLELTGVQKRFGEVAAVENFDLAAERGEFVSFLGPSGCGKTTTLRMIAGFEQPTAGLIQIDGRDITYKAPNQRNVGDGLPVVRPVPEHDRRRQRGLRAACSQEAEGPDPEAGHGAAGAHPSAREGRPLPYQLSGGQQQRVALARALAIEPQVLLLDEPLSALDAKIRIILRAEIRAIQRSLGITTVYVTHDQEEALSLSDRVVVMSEGRIEQIGTPFEIYNFPATAFVASFVGTLNLVAAGVIDAGAGRLSVDGQEVRVAKAVSGAGSDGRVTLALRPEGISFGEGPAGANRLRGTVEDINFLGSIVRVRLRLGDGPAADGATTIALDTFNEPHLALPAVGDLVTAHFPPEACFVLGAARDGVAATVDPDAEV